MIPSYLFQDFAPRVLLIEHLEVAKAHETIGERNIALQKQLIGRLNDNGRATEAAKSVLSALVEIQAMYVAHRERLEGELARAHYD